MNLARSEISGKALVESVYGVDIVDSVDSVDSADGVDASDR